MRMIKEIEFTPLTRLDEIFSKVNSISLKNQYNNIWQNTLLHVITCLTGLVDE